jgi:tetratricopeptide (TPR) repeat protein
MATNAAENANTKAEDYLRKAAQAESSGARAKYATRGLAKVGTDRTLKAMLLRQLYLSHMESERFEKASEVAREAVELGIMPDVACQDLARAYLGLGRQREAADELRRAGRLGPASRRAFHLWTLGSLQYFGGDPAAAVVAFERALRWGTTARPLYAAQLHLARRQLVASDERAASREAEQADGEELEALRQALDAAPSGQGYGRLILGELAHAAGDLSAAREYLEEFVKRTLAGRVALRIGLRAELDRARALLALLDLEPASDPSARKFEGPG